MTGVERLRARPYASISSARTRYAARPGPSSLSPLVVASGGSKVTEHGATELSVQGESIQQLYSQFTQGRFLVNRRYQRKLVWSVEEKARLVDSVLNRLPIPLILLAETT